MKCKMINDPHITLIYAVSLSVT